MKRAIGLAILAAALFGSATPASKMLLARIPPFQLAGLLYLGAAAGIAPIALRGRGIGIPARGDRRNRLRLLGAVVSGGIGGPVLLLFGLRLAMAASVALWLSFEVAATALLGALIFKDHLGRIGWVGVGSAFGGIVLLSLPAGASGLTAGGFVLLACLCWGVDNQLTSLIDGISPTQVTFWKGLTAGAVNLAIGLALAPMSAGPAAVVLALLLGAFAYGASIACYISSAQVIGATRAQIAFATAPIFGVVISVLALGESFGMTQLGSAVLLALGIGLITLESHEHHHHHEAMEHEHSHRHDDGHHDHEHPGLPASAQHSHRHRHAPSAHSHPHWPDLHHRHGHQ